MRPIATLPGSHMSIHCLRFLVTSILGFSSSRYASQDHGDGGQSCIFGRHDNRQLRYCEIQFPVPSFDSDPERPREVALRWFDLIWRKGLQICTTIQRLMVPISCLLKRESNFGKINAGSTVGNSCAFKDVAKTSPDK